MKLILLVIFFIQAALAQTYVTEKSETRLKFQGTVMSEGKDNQGVITVRETQGQQRVLMVNEVTNFRFSTEFEESEFNDEYMESQYFPQIRVSGALVEKIDLTRDGIYLVNFKGTFTMRYQSIPVETPVRLEISGGSMNFSFSSRLELARFNVPYAGAGSEIGQFADYTFSAKLRRTH